MFSLLADLQRECAVGGKTAPGLLSVATDPHLDGWGWSQLGCAAFALVIGVAMLLWARQVAFTSARWTARSPQEAER